MPKTAEEKLVGRRGIYTVTPNPKIPENTMGVEVRIVEVFRGYGRVDVDIEPVKGTGRARVTLGKIKLQK